MRLQSIHVHGYKRFEEPSTMYVRSPLVAVVGPNEAGKTSLLKAARHLSHREAFDRREFSGRREPGTRDGDPNPLIVSARFSLDRGDREAVGALLSRDHGPAFDVRKRADGAIRWRLSPPLRRDRKPREGVVRNLQQAINGNWLPYEAPEPPPGEEPARSPQDQAVELHDMLTDAGENLSAEVIESIRAFASALAEAMPKNPRKRLEQLPGRLDQLADAEAERNPNDVAGGILLARKPEFLLFDEDERTLVSYYAWAEYGTPTAALSNLFALADTDWTSFRNVATDADRRDELMTLELAANERLERAFGVWTQAKVSVALRADEQGLELLVRDRETKHHTRLGERSAGLRAFAALVAFTARYAGEQPPILLVDEAETHLHYGGQADLVKVFERQKVAQCIIYTTHSIGMLPEDLGSTIRVVAPTASERSKIGNSFWREGVGLTPMVLAMGANALAFTPARFAVIGEGESEAILLPSVLREARGAERADEPLGFQVAPGVAEVRPETADELEFEAGNVVYLVDADKGGRAHARKLPERARAEGRIVELGEGKEPGLCIEDFIEANLLVDAFNAVLARTRPAVSARLDSSKLPKVGRGPYLDAWAKRRCDKPLSKTLIAQEAIDLRRERDRLVEPKRESMARALHQRLLDAFQPGTSWRL
jgi:hypothetical protein